VDPDIVVPCRTRGVGSDLLLLAMLSEVEFSFAVDENSEGGGKE
jgi:hypothetical protein